MKVLALNSSPRTGNGSKTELLLDPLVRGMRETGAEVEVVELRRKSVRNCIGCFTCWTKTPGVCIHKDDMTRELFPKWKEAELVVYATPLYHYTVNASLKAFIERTLPALQPFFKERDGKTSHPARVRHPKVVVLSVAGFPEMSVFDQLSSWANFVFGRSGGLVAEIYRPMAESMTTPFLKAKAEEVLQAAVQAGREIVETMRVSEETMSRVTQPLMKDPRPLFEIGNLMWKTCIAKGVTPGDLGKRRLIPRPDSIESFLLILSMGFRPEAAGDMKATVQFRFTGEVEGVCRIRIENGRIEAAVGAEENPDLAVETPFSLWMDILAGKADGRKMFMEQKYKVAGDLSLLTELSRLFGG